MMMDEAEVYTPFGVFKWNGDKRCSISDERARLTKQFFGFRHFNLYYFKAFNGGSLL